MIVPDFWVEARKQHRDSGRQITVRRLGWSTLSAEEAAAMAEQRAEEALRRLIAGESLIRREPKVPYNGADGIPIREEVLARHGEEVITRNSYGARCLNSPSALFADVDFDPPFSFRRIAATFLFLAVLSAVHGATLGHWGVSLGLLAASLVFAAPLTALIVRVGTVLRGGPQAIAKGRISRFLSRQPEWSIRLYRTPNGLRLLATHRRFEPSDPDVRKFFQAIGADPIYVRMCNHQQCFRARLTAKPWRIGISDHMRPRPGVWPVAPERMDLRTAWVTTYDAKASQFASCRFIESLGSGLVHERLRSVVELHDRECRATIASAVIA